MITEGKSRQTQAIILNERQAATIAEFHRSMINNEPFSFDLSGEINNNQECSRALQLNNSLMQASAIRYIEMHPEVINDSVCTKIIQLCSVNDFDMIDLGTHFFSSIFTDSRIFYKLQNHSSIANYLTSIILQNASLDIITTAYESLVLMVLYSEECARDVFKDSFISFSLDLVTTQLNVISGSPITSDQEEQSYFLIHSILRCFSAYCHHPSLATTEFNNSLNNIIQRMFSIAQTKNRLYLFVFNLIYWYSLYGSADHVRPVLTNEFYEALDIVFELSMEQESDLLEEALFAIAALTTKGEDICSRFAIPILGFLEEFQGWSFDGTLCEAICIIFRNFASSMMSDTFLCLCQECIASFIAKAAEIGNFRTKQECMYTICYLTMNNNSVSMQCVLTHFINIFPHFGVFLRDEDYRMGLAITRAIINVARYLDANFPNQLPSFIQSIESSSEIIEAMNSNVESTNEELSSLSSMALQYLHE